MKGQIALIVLIISAVMVTIGLSISRRSVVENRINSDEESLKQAFNAAESGIENYLKTGQTTYFSSDSLSNATVVAETVGNGSTINYSEFTVANSPVFYWLREHKNDGSLNFLKGFEGTDLRVCVDNNFTGDIKVDYFYKTAGGVYNVWRSGYSFGDLGTINGYVNASGGTCAGRSDAKEAALSGAPLSGNIPLLLVVSPIFSGTHISVGSVTGTFPIQGLNLSSTGKVGPIEAGVAGNSVQVVREIVGYSVPEFMLEALNTEGNVLSN